MLAASNLLFIIFHTPKKFKRKAEKTGIIKEVRRRREFEKPSVTKRKAMQHAIYVNKLHQEEE